MGADDTYEDAVRDDRRCLGRAIATFLAIAALGLAAVVGGAFAVHWRLGLATIAALLLVPGWSLARSARGER